MVGLGDIREARARIASALNRTPLDRSYTLSSMTGCQVYLKPENLQRTGSFKVRGALHKVSLLGPDELGRGVVTASSGNHGQAVAHAAARSGARAVVVMPAQAVEAKVRAARAYGAEVILHGTTSEERMAMARQLARERDAVFVHSFDDEAVIAGQGTVGLEIMEELPDVDVVLVPVGGGGLVSGIAVAVKETRPGAKVFGVEPEGSACMHLSLARGAVTEVPAPQTMADGLRTQKPGRLTFEIAARYLDGVLLVKEEQICQAMLLLLERAKLLVEPSGAVTVAALLGGALRGTGRKVVVVLSGGNVDLRRVAELIALPAGGYSTPGS